MWTNDHRETHRPREARYPSDISDEEWAIIEPMLRTRETPPARGPLAPAEALVEG